jgi:hypothetical protein
VGTVSNVNVSSTTATVNVEVPVAKVSVAVTVARADGDGVTGVPCSVRTDPVLETRIPDGSSLDVKDEIGNPAPEVAVYAIAVSIASDRPTMNVYAAPGKGVTTTVSVSTTIVTVISPTIPFVLVAVIVAVEVPATVGVPVMNPCCKTRSNVIDNPGGRLPDMVSIFADTEVPGKKLSALSRYVRGTATPV